MLLEPKDLITNTPDILRFSLLDSAILDKSTLDLG